MQDDERPGAGTPGSADTLQATMAPPAPVRPAFGVYEVQGEVGAGGMGIVYAGRTPDGTRVAIKRLRSELSSDNSRDRFLREAQVLEQLEHPALVKHVAHGSTEEGDPYLVMEWMEGEDLSAAIGRAPLSVDQTIELGLRVAAGLAVAHASGVVHRDLKPSNVFLPGGDPSQAKVIDFGVARWRLASHALTRTGGIVGTPGYMSPEQARGEGDLDERTDVYSLGCVLYECLTGRPPFTGEHAIAVLAKILLEDAQPIEELRPDVPQPIRDTLREMMDRDRGARLPTMADVVDALERARASAGEIVSASQATAPGVSRRERQFLTLVALAGADPFVEPLAPLIARYRGIPLGMVQARHLVVFEADGSPTDVAARAARCALDVHSTIPSSTLAVVSGRAELTGGSVVGQILERVGGVFDGAAGGIKLDALTRDLLDERFEIEEEQQGLVLRGFAPERVSVRRTVLGRTTPFVGRVRELTRLLGIVEGAIEEESACAIVVTAAPGIGKSRLRHELMTRLAKEHELRELIGRGDAMSDRVSFGLIARAIRTHAGISAGELAAEQRAKVRRMLPAGSDRDNVELFLAELAGVPAADPVPAALRVARQDPAIMRDSFRSAWTTWIRAETSLRPVVLVLEDLHWGDEATLDLVAHSLDSLRESPFIVPALARPELDDRFGPFWTNSDVTRIALSPLSPKASRKLVDDVVGPGCPDAVSQRIAELSGGNAFYLEELVRIAAASEGSSELELPESILATARARFGRLDENARRLLRAASVFGERFWSGGLQALLPDLTPQEIHSTLEKVVQHEHVVGRPTSAIAGNREFQFAHALVRDAAYAALTAEDRQLAHDLAARWLEAHSAAEAFVLADHYRRAGDRLQAGLWYLRAARQSVDAFDFRGALDHAERGLEQEVTAQRGELLGVRMIAQVYLGQYEVAVQTSASCMPLIEPQSATYWALESLLAEALGRQGRFDEVIELLDRDLSVPQPHGPTFEPWLAACARAAMHVGKGRGFRVVGPYAKRLEAVAGSSQLGVNTRLSLLQLKQELADQAGDLGTCYRQLPELHALEAELHAGAGTDFVLSYGHVFAQLGLNQEAEEHLRAEFEFSSRRGMQHGSFVAAAMLGGMAIRREAWDEAREWFDRADAFPTSDPRMRGPVAGFRAMIAAHADDLDEALRWARECERLLGAARALHPWGLCILAAILLARGETDAALEQARAGIAVYDDLGGLSEFEGYVLAAFLECLLAAGRNDEARARATAFRDRLRQRCAWIGDPELERSFVEDVPDNARLRRLCDQVLLPEE